MVGRRRPYDIVFSDDRFGAEAFTAIAADAEGHGLTTSDPDDFARLPSVARLLEQLAPEESSPAALARYLDILFHAYHFWRAGSSVYSFEESVVRTLLENPPDLSGWAPEAPAAALYLELPSNIFWATVANDMPPEPVEGLFVMLETPSEVNALAVLGIRADRPGFSVASIRASLESALAAEDPDAFRSTLPGAELAGVFSLQRPTEMITLIARLLWHLEVREGMRG